MTLITSPYLIACFALTYLTLQSLRPLANKVGLLDIPGGRKTHLSATPLIGGLGIFLGLLLVAFSLPALLVQYASLLSLSALVLFIGTIDDIKDLKPYVRMTGHTLVALAMAVVAEIQLGSLGNILFIGELQLGWLAIPFTVFATVGVINAINMSDGIDGLSGGIVIVALMSIAVLGLAHGSFSLVSFIALLICSIMAFLTMNFRRPLKRKALVYLGDAGSTMLGFILAWLLISNSQGTEQLFAPVHALWFLALPLFDTVNLLFKRPMRGVSPFQPGEDHLHHKLLGCGLSELQVVAVLLTTSVIFAMVGVLGYFYEFSEAFLFQAFISVFILYFLFEHKIVKTAPTSI